MTIESVNNNNQFNKSFEKNLILFKEIKISDLKTSKFIERNLYIFLNEHCNTLADVMTFSIEEASGIKGFGKSKSENLIKLKRELKSNPKKFILYHKNNCQIIELPFHYNKNKPLNETIFDCFNDLLEVLSKRERFQDVNIIKLYYGLNDEEPKSMDQIAKIIEKEYERVRQVLFHEVQIKFLFAGSEVRNIKINKMIVDKIYEIKKESIYNGKFKNLISKGNEIDELKLTRIAEIINCNIVNEIDEECFLVKEDESINFRENYRALLSVLTSDAIPSMDVDILFKVKKSIKKGYFKKDFILSILDCSNKIESRIVPNNTLLYQIKWKYLQSLNLKAKRIVYESKSGLFRNDILVEYNRRCVANNFDNTTEEQLILKSDNNFKSQRNGYWEYVSDSNNKNKEKIINFIGKYIISQKGKVNFSQIKTLIDKEYNYPEKTIRNYILISCLVSKTDKNLFIHEDYINDYPDILIRDRKQKDVGNRLINNAINFLKTCENNSSERISFNSEVLKMLNKERIKINKNSFNYYIQRFLNEDILIENDNNIYFDKDNVSKYDLDRLGKRIEIEYKTRIRSLAINYIKGKDNFQCSLKELLDNFKIYLPEGIKENAIYRIFNECEYFEKTGKGRESLIKLKTDLLPQLKPYKEEVQRPLVKKITSLNLVKKDNTKTEKVNYQYENYSKRNHYDWTILKKSIKDELLHGKHYFFTENEIDKGLEIFYKIVLKDDYTKWGTYLLQSIYETLLEKSDAFDRDSNLTKLAHGYETYLLCFSSFNRVNHGISEVIDLFPIMRDLRNYKYDLKKLAHNEIDIRKRNFSDILSKSIQYGNLVRHNGKDIALDMSMVEHAKKITDTMALYVYTANLLMN